MTKSNYFLKSFKIDIHEKTELEARKFLEKEIIRLYKLGYRRINVIHGYRGGDVLKNMVLKTLRSNLIIERNLDPFNIGKTELILKEK